MVEALIIIDMQEDFFSESSPLFVDNGKAIIPNVKKLLETFREINKPIIFIKRAHRGYIDLDKPRLNLPYTILNEKSKGSKIISELKPKDNEIVVIKKRFSAFFMTELELILRRLKVDTLFICGVQTPNCIRQTAVDALQYDYNVFVIEDGTASKSESVQKSNLFDLKNMGVNIISTDEAIKLVRG